MRKMFNKIKNLIKKIKKNKRIDWKNNYTRITISDEKNKLFLDKPQPLSTSEIKILEVLGDYLQQRKSPFRFSSYLPYPKEILIKNIEKYLEYMNSRDYTHLTKNKVEDIKKHLNTIFDMKALLSMYYDHKIHPEDEEILTSLENGEITYESLSIEVADRLLLRYSLPTQLPSNLEIIEKCNKAIEINPDDFDSWNIKGDALLELDRYKESIEAFNKAIIIDPDKNNEILSNKIINIKKKYEKDPLEVVNNNELSENVSTEFNKLIEKGEICLNSKDNEINYSKAVTYFSEAINIDPNNFKAYKLRGTAYRLKGELENAANDYNMALEIKPNDAEIFYDFGALYNNYDSELSIQFLSKAIEISPQFANAYLSRSSVYKDIGKIEESKKDIEIYTKIITGRLNSLNQLFEDK